MIKYKVERNFYKYNIEIVNRVINLLSEKIGKSDNPYGFSKETIGEFDDLLQYFLSSFNQEKDYVEDERIETEEEAKEYFGEDFIEKFEEIRKKCEELKMELAVHGTDIETAKNIQESGLKYKSPQILSTAFILSGRDIEQQYSKYSKLLNWPHRNYKGLVMLGVPKECFGFHKEDKSGSKPLWKYTKANEDTRLANASQEYSITPEFILGYIDVEKKKIIDNHNFKREHEYDELEYDTDITHKLVDLSNEENDIGSFSEPTYSVVETENKENYYNPKEIVIDSKEELLINFRDLERIFKKDGRIDEKFFYEVKNIINEELKKLSKIVPQLESNQEIYEKIKKEEEERKEYEAKLARGEIKEQKFDETEWSNGWDDEFDDITEKLGKETELYQEDIITMDEIESIEKIENEKVRSDLTSKKEIKE